jgi:hypothetical protein
MFMIRYRIGDSQSVVPRANRMAPSLTCSPLSSMGYARILNPNPVNRSRSETQRTSEAGSPKARWEESWLSSRHQASIFTRPSSREVNQCRSRRSSRNRPLNDSMNALLVEFPDSPLSQPDAVEVRPQVERPPGNLRAAANPQARRDRAP